MNDDFDARLFYDKSRVIETIKGQVSDEGRLKAALMIKDIDELPPDIMNSIPNSDCSLTHIKSPSEETEESLPQPVTYQRDGEYIVFGSYEQDGDTGNGPEPIYWEVVSEENGRMLVVSRYILDFQHYNNSKSHVTWEECTLRA